MGGSDNWWHRDSWGTVINGKRETAQGQEYLRGIPYNTEMLRDSGNWLIGSGPDPQRSTVSWLRVQYPCSSPRTYVCHSQSIKHFWHTFVRNILLLGTMPACFSIHCGCYILFPEHPSILYFPLYQDAPNGKHSQEHPEFRTLAAALNHWAQPALLR